MFECLPTCEFATLLDKFKPEVCGRCYPKEYAERVDRVRVGAVAFVSGLTFRMPEAVECDACGEDGARPSDRFCRRCGARGDGGAPDTYVSYQVREAARLSQPSSWQKKPKAEPKSAPEKPKGSEQVVSHILLAGPVVEKAKRRRAK